MHTHTKYNSCIISATLMKKAGIYLEMHAASTYGLVEQGKRFAHRMYPVLHPQSLKMLSQAELTKMLWFHNLDAGFYNICLVLFIAFSCQA